MALLSRRARAANSADNKQVSLLLGCEGLLEKKRIIYVNFSISKNDEELYHKCCLHADAQWLISHGPNLAAISTLEIAEVQQSFVEYPDKMINAYVELVARGGMKLLELLQIMHQLEREPGLPHRCDNCGFPIFAHPRDILNPFALENEIPLKESLEAHTIRLAKKKGLRASRIYALCAAHIPRSDGVPVSVATVSPKDSELSGKLEEAGDAAYQRWEFRIPVVVHSTRLSSLSNLSFLCMLASFVESNLWFFCKSYPFWDHVKAILLDP
ncbi:hypothetical protein Tco_1530205 [Tanacetum coccineum]